MKTLQTGVTLVELMVTISILAILAAIAMPNFASLMLTNRLASQTNDVMAAVTTARAEAIRRNQRVVVCRYDGINANGTVPATFACNTTAGVWGGVVVFNDANGNNAYDGANADPRLNEELIKVVRFDTSRFQVQAGPIISALSNEIVFRGDGIARDGAGAFLNSGQLRICIDSNDGNNARDISLRGGGKTVLTQATSATCAAPTE